MKYIKTLDGAIALLLTIVFIALFFLLTSCTNRLHCPPPPTKKGKVFQKLPQPREAYMIRKTRKP